MELRTESDQSDVLAFFGQEDVKVSAYSPEEVQWYGETITPDIVKPVLPVKPVEVKKKAGRPKKVVTEI